MKVTLRSTEQEDLLDAAEILMILLVSTPLISAKAGATTAEAICSEDN